MRIEEEYIKAGYFWLPEQENHKIPGTLTIHDGGKIELEVLGLFDDRIKALNGEDDLSRIIGYVEKDGLVTLDDCFYTTKNISFGCISKSKVCVNRVFSGVPYDKNEDVTFNTLSFSVDLMDEWVGISGIEVQNDWYNKTTTISCNPLESISYQLDNGMQLKIGFAYTMPIVPTIKEAKITQKAYFKLSSEILRSLDDFVEIACKLTTLMCFAIDATVTLKNLTATSMTIQREVGQGKRYPIPVKIFFQSIPYSEKSPKKSWHDMLFNYEAIKNNAQNIFNNWINAYDILSPAFSLYFSAKVGDYKYLDGKFLALAQGLETYHRRTSHKKIMDESEFSSLVNHLLNNCPEEKKSWLKDRLKHGNEINLRQRIKTIIEPFKEHLGSSKYRNKLLTNIVDTRNYLTHYSEELKDKSAEGKELWLLCQKMEAIFQLHFLKVLGFSEDEIQNVIENCYPLKQKINSNS